MNEVDYWVSMYTYNSVDVLLELEFGLTEEQVVHGSMLIE